MECIGNTKEDVRAGSCQTIQPFNFGGGEPEPLDSEPVAVQYCLAQKVPDACQLSVSLTFLAAVLACNLIKAVCKYLTIRTVQVEPLATLGDAIASFWMRQMCILLTLGP